MSEFLVTDFFSSSPDPACFPIILCHVSHSAVSFNSMLTYLQRGSRDFCFIIKHKASHSCFIDNVSVVSSWGLVPVRRCKVTPEMAEQNAGAIEGKLCDRLDGFSVLGCGVLAIIHKTLGLNPSTVTIDNERNPDPTQTNQPANQLTN